MKRHILALLIAGAITGQLSGQTILINEDFDSYNAGDLLAQTAGLPWSTWSVSPGSTEDTPISDEYASSGTLSAKVTGVPAGGPTDLILQLGNRTTGNYLLSWNMYIPSGNGGYYNLQHNQVPGNGSWMLDVTFNPDGTIDYLVNSVTMTGTYTHDEWFNVTMSINMNTMAGIVLIDGTPQYNWQTNVPGPSQLGGVDFFGYAGGGTNTPLYYIDDVLFVDMATVNVPEVALPEISVYPNPAQDLLTVEVPGTSGKAVVSLVDVTGRTVLEGRSFLQQGAVARMQLGLNGLPSGLYFVRVADGDREIVRRVTKQ